MGVKPTAIAGCSIGAVIGAGYAAGLTGRAMRRHLLDLAHNPGEVWRRVTGARAVPWSQFLGAGFGNPLAVDAGKFFDAFLGDLLPADFSDWRLPFSAIATDLHCTGRHCFHRRSAQACGRCRNGGARPRAPARA